MSSFGLFVCLCVGWFGFFPFGKLLILALYILKFLIFYEEFLYEA